MAYILEGNISVKAALLAKRRTVRRILVDKDKKDRDTAFIVKEAQKQNVCVEYVSRQKIEEMAKGNSHGGILCEAEEREYQSLADMENKSFLCLLEGIEDPYNFGYCLRSLYAAGCEGILIGERNWYQAITEVLRSSAGAAEYLDVYQTKDLKEALLKLRSQYRIIAAERKDAVSLFETDLTEPLILCIGGEKRGLSKDVRDLADQNVFIPYTSGFRNALNASGAVSVFAFEISRQRSRKA